MSREICIKNPRLIKKSLPIESILEGSPYEYGIIDEYDRMTDFGVVGECTTVVDRDHIGRGVQILNPENKKEIQLSLPLPATSYDFRVLYTLAKRVAQLWGANNIIDLDYDKKVSIDDLDNQIKMDCEDCIRLLADEGRYTDTVVLPCALFPISFKPEALQAFGDADHYDAFADYLHEKQSIGAWFAVPHLEQLPELDDIAAWFLLLSEVPCIVPSVPSLRYQDAEGQIHKVEQYAFRYRSKTKGTLRVDYAFLLKHIPQDNIQPFDEDHLVISPLSDDILTDLFL